MSDAGLTIVKMFAIPVIALIFLLLTDLLRKSDKDS